MSADPTTLLDKTLLYIAFSEAKGNLGYISDLLQKLENLDKTNEITPYINSKKQIDCAKLSTQLDQVTSNMSHCAKMVPILGHKSFKSAIEWNGITFHKEGLYWNNIQLFNSKQKILFAHHIFHPNIVMLLLLMMN